VAVEKIKEDKEDIRKKLKDLSREELIEQFIKAKVCPSGAHTISGCC
jgi:hypothetical protein